MSHARLRVGIVDDDDMWLALTNALADTDERVDLVLRARDGAETLVRVGEVRPDVVLVDLALPEVDGLTLLPELATRSPATRFVVVTGNDYEPLRELAVEAGAVGLLSKDPLATLFDRLLDLLAVQDR